MSVCNMGVLCKRDSWSFAINKKYLQSFKIRLVTTSTFSFLYFIRRNAMTLKIGFFTAAAIIFFQIISTLVLYRFIRLDLYLCFVAILFFIMGKFLNKKEVPVKEQAPVLQSNILLLLSAKELQILKLIAEGKTNKEIAAIQFIEISTVKTHINNIYTKLSIKNRKEASVKYNELFTSHSS